MALNTAQPPIVFSLIETTAPLAKTIAAALNAEHKTISGNALNEIAAAFTQGRPIIGLMASGILIRAIAPHLADKHQDAPVIAVSPDGQQIVPLTGGHHGANALAKSIAAITTGNAAITTASDTQFNVSLDEPPHGYTLANPNDFKPFIIKVLSGQAVKLDGNAPWISESDLPFSDKASLTIKVTEQSIAGDENTLVYHPHILAIGLGCERNATVDELSQHVSQCLENANLSPLSIACFASIDLKADEAAITALCQQYAKPAQFFTATELNAVSDRLKNPSDIVLKEVGCAGVSEGAALAGGGLEATLIVEKTKSARTTCSIAQSPTPIIAHQGHQRGKLSVVGIGPGSLEWRSPEATQTLMATTDWVGYDLYLDLAADLKSTQTEHRFGLGKEEARVRHAFELAGQGKHVALVCSGDANIYAMGALTYEVLDSETLPDAQTRVEIHIVPGISAFQAASARAGAIIGHDFCTISLSDLLTPWETIENRLHAAAKGDFNIAFYNPRSLKRIDQLQRAIDILQPHRTDDTPVIIASNLGRPTEKVKTVRFADFDPNEVDMLTIVLVGSSQSKIIHRGDGQNYCYTPRGYANKAGTANKVDATNTKETT